MEKKITRSANRRRPQNLKIVQRDITQPTVKRENETSKVVPTTQPVFASVHRTRRANISSIQRDINKKLIESHYTSNHQPKIIFSIAQDANIRKEMLLPSVDKVAPKLTNIQSTAIPGIVPGTTSNRNFQSMIPIQQNQVQSSQSLSTQHKETILQARKQPTVSVQQNFNHISKTATNLLHDIYEKHLLNQTTFENVTILNNRSLVPSSNSDIKQTIGIPISNDEFVNNLRYNQQFIKSQLNCLSTKSNQNPIVFQHSLSLQKTNIDQHLYQTIEDTSKRNLPSATLNRLLKKRSLGKFQRNNKNSIQGRQNNLTNQQNPISMGIVENYFGVSNSMNNFQNQHNHSHHHHHHEQQQQQQQQQHLNQLKDQREQNQYNHHNQIPYNHQTRTQADGEYYSHEISPTKICGEMLVHTVGSLLTTDFPLDRKITNNDAIQCIHRAIPIGCSQLDVVHDNNDDNGACKNLTKVGKVKENIQDINGINSTTTKYQYRNSKIDLMLETAQAVAAAAYYARAAQKLAQSSSSRNRSTDMHGSTRNGGFCGALQRAPPPLPGGLARRLANKENYGIGKVKVMLRVSDNHVDDESSHFMSIDKKKRQVTLTDPLSAITSATTSQERGPMVAAPKMFAFDGLFTPEDQQTDVCASALSEVIPAVLEGSDGCLLTIGYPSSGQTKTMFGTVNSSNELGAIPCAISWLYKGINERRQKSGARFSVRVSALGVCPTKPDSTSKDLLAAHATDSDESPGVYLRDDFLGGPTELRAPTAERAALFLDAALAGRPQTGLEPAIIFTLHVYQYSLSGKGGVAGGRSRLHLIDLGGCANRSGGLPLSSIGNTLLAILSGQRHPPNKDHPLTPLLKDCLAPLTCHVTILAHVTHTQTYADALTTIQLASRIHRMRRRKHRFQISSDKTLGVNNTGHQSGGSSEGPDPSSSDLSADTVIYMGPCDDATDGEHPPVYLPSLSSGDNRCAMNKVLKGCVVEKQPKTPIRRIINKAQSPNISQRNDNIKRTNIVPSSSPTASQTEIHSSPGQSSTKMLTSSPKLVGGTLRQHCLNKGSNVPTPKSSPLHRSNLSSTAESPKRKISEEQWIDGPRISRSKVAEARHLLREINHVKQCETWIDGPKSASTKSLTAGNLPGSTQTPGYGFMDNHKKSMIRQWVENQSSHVFTSTGNSPVHQTILTQQQILSAAINLTQFKQKSENDQSSSSSNIEMIDPIMTTILDNSMNPAESSIRSGLKTQLIDLDLHSIKSDLSGHSRQDGQEEEDQDSGPSEVPPALPLIEPLGSREISHESLHRIISRHVSRESLSISQQNVQTVDCGLQVTEEEIARTMGCEHPLSALSHGDMSVVSSFNIGDAFSDCAMGERTRHQFDQLAQLREIYTSQLAMAEVIPSAFRLGDTGSVYSEPAFRFMPGPESVFSEPAYHPPNARCRSCRQSLHLSRTPSQSSLPSLNGIMTIAGMEQYASLRHPDGASDPNLQKTDKLIINTEEDDINEKSELLDRKSSLEHNENIIMTEPKIITQIQLPLLPLSTSEAYDSGHDSSTPRTSKHSGISRRAESGYHSVATARDSDESSFISGVSKVNNRITMKKKRQDKSLCNWLRNPFTCTYPETEGEISDF